MSKLSMALAAAGLTFVAGGAAAQLGNAAMPIELKMKRGTDSLTVHGRLEPDVACCTYVFKAAAGQTLSWRETGAAVRLVITYPDGRSEGPGFANPLLLPASGVYTLAVTPDTMADNAYGPFTLNLRIPPAGR